MRKQPAASLPRLIWGMGGVVAPGSARHAAGAASRPRSGAAAARAPYFAPFSHLALHFRARVWITVGEAPTPAMVAAPATR
jgi:hypothetical protein